MRAAATVLVSAAFVTIASMQAPAQERLDQDAYWKIRREAAAGSRILDTLHVLTDVYGPRLTGSPNLKAAGEWALEQMKAWGLKNGRLEPWDFGHPGWTNERLAVHIVSPVKDHLVAEVLAWTPGTKGPVRATALQLTLPPQPTQEELDAYLDTVAARIKGAIVLVGEPRRVLVSFNPVPLRREDRDVAAQFGPAAPITPAPAPAPAASGTAAAEPIRRVLTAGQIDARVNRFMLDRGGLVRINDAGRDHGQIQAFGNRTYDPATAPPTIVLRNEDYGRIARLLADGRSVELEVDIVNRTHPEGRTNYNVIAEIPGSDKAQEVVMLGGHLDSWHAATGATDNAVGCTVMLEAVRILKAAGLTPRRTIRVALWSGEEQGLLGSAAYVRDHFGSVEDPKAEFAKFAGYFNVDSGTGRVRGFTVFGPVEAAAVLRDAVAPLEDLGISGAASTRSRVRGITDSTSFNEAGLPGIGTQLDPIQYATHTWHTNLDTYERIVEDDVRASAIVIASAVYHLAMRESLLPRFSAAQMPEKPGTPRPSNSGSRP